MAIKSMKKSGGGAGGISSIFGKKALTADEQIQTLTTPTPTFDFSTSPIKNASLSSFNLGTSMPGNSFTNLSLNTKIGYTGDTTLSTPTVSLTVPTSFNITIPTTTQPTTNTNTGTNTNTNTSTTPTVDCSQFDATPSCSYVGSAGSDAYNTCKTCYPNK